MLEIESRIRATVGGFLRELPDTRGKVAMNTDSDGIVHLKGAVDSKRRTIDPLHSAFGYTSQDVTDLRSHLSAIGIKLSWDDVEALLLEAQHSGIKGSTGMPIGTKRAKWREQRAARRQWAREHGICVICTKNAAGYRESDGSQMATCRDCQAKSNAAKKQRGQRIRAAESPSRKTGSEFHA